MIARISTSPPVNDPAVSRARLENAQRRIKPALAEQPGFRIALWLRKPDGTVHSITVFDSEAELGAAAVAVNAVPMLPGQDPADMAGPDSGQTVEVAEVLDFAFPLAAGG